MIANRHVFVFTLILNPGITPQQKKKNCRGSEESTNPSVFVAFCAKIAWNVGRPTGLGGGARRRLTFQTT